MTQQVLDRSRPYGIVAPPMRVDDEHVAHYDQDGKLFDNSFRRIYMPGEKRPEEQAADPMAKARAAKAAKQAAEVSSDTTPVGEIYKKPPWRRNTPKATFTPKDGKSKGRKYPRAGRTVGKPAPAVAPKPAESVKPSSVNLSAWAMGTEKYLFGPVRDEIRNRFNVVVSNEQDALEILIREKVVTPSEIPGYGSGGDAEPAETAE